MIVKDDKFINNATFKYLYPILRKHGAEFEEKIRKINKQGMFAFDVESKSFGNHIFMLIDVDMNDTKTLESILGDLSENNYIDESYIFSVKKTSKTPQKIVISLKYPEEYKNVAEKMFGTKYSLNKLYSYDDIEKYFTSNNKKLLSHYIKIRNVLHGKMQDKTVNIINETLNL